MIEGIIAATDLSTVITELFDAGALARVIVDGLSKAALYTIIAAGLSLIFGLMGVLNFAHGSFVMYGAYFGGAIVVALISAGTGDLTRLLIFFFAVALVFALMTGVGALLERRLIRPVYDRPPLFQILLTFGIVLVMDEAARIVVESRGLTPRSTWAAPPQTLPDVLDATVVLAGTTLQMLWLFQVLLGVVLVGVVWAFLNGTRYGLHIRAGSEDPEMTQALGIDVRRTFTVVFGVGSGLAALAGVILMWDPRFGASVPLAVDALLFAFVVVIIGGLGSFQGTVVAGVFVGFIDGLATWLFVSYSAISVAGIMTIPISAELPEMIMFLALVGVLIVKPTGLFGIEEVGGH